MKLTNEAAARHVTVRELMLGILRAGLNDEPLVPFHAALDPVPGDSANTKKMKRELRARLIVAAKAVNMPTADLVRQGVNRICQEFEASGRIRFGGPLMPVAPRTPKKPDNLGSWEEIDLSGWKPETIATVKAGARKKHQSFGQYLIGLAKAHFPATAPAAITVKPGHQAKLRWAGSMLEVKPETFLGWVLDAYFESLLDPINGLLYEWAAGGLMKYDTETAARVKARFLKWARRKLGKNLIHGEEAES